MHRPGPQPRPARRLSCFLMLAALVPCSGCPPMRNFLVQPFQEPCRISPEISQVQLVSFLNENARNVRSWTSSDVSIHTPGPGGVPVRLSADIAVESPRNFRLVAKSMLGYEADLGSNPEQFWFWTRRSEPKHVFMARHDEIDQVRRRYQIPFRPDWLMEVLGAVPIDEGNVTMEPRDPASGVIRLISYKPSPDGRPMRRTIQVDACTGYILSHALHDSAGRLVAQASLNDYREHPIDGTSRVRLPHRIELNWPQAGLKMTMTIGQIEVNPPPLSEQMWQVPDYPGSPPFDLGRQVVPTAAIGRPRARGQTLQSPLQPDRSGRRAAPSAVPSRPRFAEDDVPQWADSEPDAPSIGF